jgi:hypothetical protein
MVTANLQFTDLGLYVEYDGNLVEHATAVYDQDPAADGGAMYRYVLTRRWSTTQPSLGWWCRNPSTATAFLSDQTVAKIKEFTRRGGYGGFDLLNLDALRSTDPTVLDNHPAPTGPHNDAILAAYARHSGPVVVAWGGLPPSDRVRARAAQAITLLTEAGTSVLCLGTTKGGYPRHPSRVGYDTPLVSYRPQDVAA